MTQSKTPKAKGAEKRLHPRVDARIEVRIQSSSEYASCYTQNISRGGIYLESAELPDPNATVEIILLLDSILSEPSNAQIRLKGRVVRLMTVNDNNKTLHKIGIQFVDLTPETQLRLNELYERLAHSSS